MRPGENAFSLGSSCYSAIFVFTDAGIFRIWQTFPAMHIQKRRRGIPKLRYNPSLLYVRHVRGMSALRISKMVRCLHPLAARENPAANGFFCSIYIGQNELRKNDGVTPVCFWKVAEKWLLS